MSERDHRITRADIVPPDVYARERADRRRALIAIKKDRRVEVGPYITFYFENFSTMLAQVHEMLHIEKGGEDQIAGEIEAYNPLIPQGSELVATMMIEIDDPVRRATQLKRLAGIEDSVTLDIGASRIAAMPADYDDRLSEDGKTSSVHWVRFAVTPDEIAAFKTGAVPAILGIAHPNYGHMAVLPPATRVALSRDFNVD